MNIAVSTEALRQHMAFQARRERMRAAAWRPKVIAPPKKPIAKVKGFNITVDHNSHVIIYRVFHGAMEKVNAIQDSRTRLEMKDIKLFALWSFWTVGDVSVSPNYFKMSDLNGPARDRHIVLVRQVAMYICKELLGKSFPVIGREFGGRDHTTALHAHRKVEGLIATRRLLMNGKPFNIDRIGEI